MKKSIFLVLTLAIPVAIFLFLKIFGSNEFEVPVLYEEGIPDCPSATKPHQVSFINLVEGDSALVSTDQVNGFAVYGALSLGDRAKLDEQIIQLVRIQDAFYEIGSPEFVLLTDAQEGVASLQSLLVKAGFLKENFHLGYLPQGDFDEFLRCGLGLSGQKEDRLWKLILVDEQRRIRGIYDGVDMDQTEQLILELKILRKKA